jgi:hypothetical protein
MRTQFDRTALAILLSKCPTPSGSYDTLFRWFWDFRGSKLEYGINVAVEKITDDMIDGRAPFVIFKSLNGRWSATTVISVNDNPDPIIENRTFNLYFANGIEYICLTPTVLAAGYLQTRNWKVRAKRSIYSPCSSRFIKVPSVIDIKSMPTIENISI